jgi:serine protease Do
MLDLRLGTTLSGGFARALRRVTATGALALTLVAGAPAALGSVALGGQPGAATGDGAAAADVAHARSLSRAFQAVARSAEPAVVHITQLARRQVIERDFFGFPVRDRGQQLLQSGVGSGVVVSADGYILTNNHVVRGADELRVRFSDGRTLPARVIGADELTDIAVVKVDESDLPAVQFADSDQVEVGEWVVAIGSPLGFDSTVTAGIVSATGRSGIPLPGANAAMYQDFIQTDAAINPGNSGGPLLNLDGRIVGINTAIASRSGAYDGIGFAVPANMARSVMESLIRTGRVSRGWMGVEFAQPEPDNTSSGPRGGVAVARLVDDGPADRAGLRPGDVITRFQSRQIDSPARLRSAIAITPPGTEAQIEVLRDGRPRTLTVRLADQQAGVAAMLGIE